jgi:hypothetical protein
VGLHARDARALETLVADLRRLHGDALIGVLLVGEAAGPEYRPRVSPLSVVVVLAAIDAQTLRRTRSRIAAWRRLRIPAPLLLEAATIERSLDVFPLELLELRDRHLLYGSAETAGLRRAAHLRPSWRTDPRQALHLMRLPRNRLVSARCGGCCSIRAGSRRCAGCWPARRQPAAPADPEALISRWKSARSRWGCAASARAPRPRAPARRAEPLSRLLADVGASALVDPRDGACRRPLAWRPLAAGRGVGAVPPLTGPVVDRAGLLSPSQRAVLDTLARELQAKTGAQMAVLTVESTAPEEIFGYGMRVAEAWQLGSREKDEGLLLVLASRDRSCASPATGWRGAVDEARPDPTGSDPQLQRGRAAIVAA